MRTTRLSAGLLCTILGLAGAAGVPLSGAQAAPEGEWGTVVNLTGPLPRAYSVDVATGPRGGTLTAWVRDDGRRAAVFVAARDAAGDWGAPARVPGSRGATDVRLEIAGDGTRTLVWTTRRAVITALGQPGRAWSTPVVLHRSRTSSTLPAFVQLAVNDRGRSVVAWLSLPADEPGATPPARVQATVGDSSGWRRAQTLSDPSKDTGAPEVAVDREGRATVVWDERTGRRSRVMTASHEPRGPWGDVRALSARRADAGPAHVAANAAGDVAVVWRFGADSSTGMSLVRWSAASGWGTPARIPGIRADIGWYDLGVDAAGTATVGWTNDAKAVWSAEQTRTGDWTRHRVAGPASVYYGLQLVVSPAGDAVLGWESVDDGNHPVWSAYRSRTSVWGPAAALSALRGDAYGPSLALARDGDAVAAWIYSRNASPDRSVVQASAFTAR